MGKIVLSKCFHCLVKFSRVKLHCQPKNVYGEEGWLGVGLRDFISTLNFPKKNLMFTKQLAINVVKAINITRAILKYVKEMFG